MTHHEAANRRRAIRPAGNRRRRALLAALLAASVVPAVGCKGAQRKHERQELIEAELRTRERELREARGELTHARIMAEAYEQQLQSYQSCPPGGGPLGPVAPAGTTPVAAVRDVALGRGTGGLDDDDCPGDELLQVVVVPRDDDGSAVKVPGRLTVSAWEVSPAGIKSPAGTWDVPPEKLRQNWKAGLFSTGYTVSLPWQKYPAYDRVRVAVRLVTLDGRTFEADRDVTVHPLHAPPPVPASGQAVPAAPGGVVPGYPVPPGREMLQPTPPPNGVPPTIAPPKVEELPLPTPSGNTTSRRGVVLGRPVSE